MAPEVVAEESNRSLGKSSAPNPPLHDNDILKLKKAGISDELILAKVEASRGMYELGADDIVRLKAAGVSEDVLSAMLASLSR